MNRTYLLYKHMVSIDDRFDEVVGLLERRRIPLVHAGCPAGHVLRGPVASAPGAPRGAAVRRSIDVCRV